MRDGEWINGVPSFVRSRGPDELENTRGILGATSQRSSRATRCARWRGASRDVSARRPRRRRGPLRSSTAARAGRRLVLPERPFDGSRRRCRPTDSRAAGTAAAAARRGHAPRGRRAREQPAPSRRAARDRGRARRPDDPGPVRPRDGRALLLGERRHGALEMAKRAQRPAAETRETRGPARRAVSASTPRSRRCATAPRSSSRGTRPAPRGVQLRARARRRCSTATRASPLSSSRGARRAGERGVARSARRHARRGRRTER